MDHSKRRIAGLPATLVVLAALAGLTGCATSKTPYLNPAATDSQQRVAAETAATQKSAANIDTQATYLKLVEQLQQDGLWFASLAHIDALEQRWGVTPESSRMRADALRQTGENVRSEEAYKRLIGTPLEGAGYHGLGLLAGSRGDYPEAVRLLKKAQQLTPTDAVLLSDLGYASLRAGLIGEARLPLMQALQLKSDNTQAQANLALYLEATRQSEQADALMEMNRMSPSTRAAIRDAARQLNGNGNGAAVRASVATAGAPPPTASAETPPPLALKPSRWPGMGGLQAASTPTTTPPTTTTPLPDSAPFTPSGSPTSRGTP